MTKSIESAQKIIQKANELGWTIEVRGNILTIRKAITPNDLESFSQADQEYYSILSLLPLTTSGSMWGTDGGGVGGLTAMQSGLFTMNISGGSIRVLKALSKLLEVE